MNNHDTFVDPDNEYSQAESELAGLLLKALPVIDAYEHGNPQLRGAVAMLRGKMQSGWEEVKPVNQASISAAWELSDALQKVEKELTGVEQMIVRKTREAFVIALKTNAIDDLAKKNVHAVDAQYIPGLLQELLVLNDSQRIDKKIDAFLQQFGAWNRPISALQAVKHITQTYKLPDGRDVYIVRAENTPYFNIGFEKPIAPKAETQNTIKSPQEREIETPRVAIDNLKELLRTFRSNNTPAIAVKAAVNAVCRAHSGKILSAQLGIDDRMSMYEGNGWKVFIGEPKGDAPFKVYVV